MIGTAIISASFVVGDTMDNMITDQVTKGMGQVDFELQSVNVGSLVYYNTTEIAPLTSNISSTQHVRAVDTLILSTISIRDNRTLLFSPSVVLLGMDSKASPTSEAWWTGTGIQFTMPAPRNGHHQ